MSAINPLPGAQAALFRRLDVTGPAARALDAGVSEAAEAFAALAAAEPADEARRDLALHAVSALALCLRRDDAEILARVHGFPAGLDTAGVAVVLACCPSLRAACRASSEDPLLDRLAAAIDDGEPVHPVLSGIWNASGDALSRALLTVIPAAVADEG